MTEGKTSLSARYNSFQRGGPFMLIKLVILHQRVGMRFLPLYFEMLLAFGALTVVFFLYPSERVLHILPPPTPST